MKKKTYLIIGIVCVLLCAVCLAIAFWPQDDTDPIQAMVELPKPEPQPEETVWVPQPEEVPVVNEPQQEPAEEAEPEPEPYVSPIDFEKIQNENPDIYGWLDVPNTEISYPLLQHQTDDTYYLCHDSSGAWAEAGAIYTEHNYNGKDLTDPVTVVYGHRMNSGARFGTLQATFEDPESFREHEEMVVYLPDRELHFEIFAAVPFNSKHLMSQYNFSSSESFDSFLQTVFDTAGNFRDGVTVSSEDQLLILSTCLKWDATRRYMVLGKLCETDDIPANAGSHITEQ